MDKLPSARSLIDINIYLASLVSNVSAIDPLLDRMRSITSGMTSTSPLSPKETATLQAVRSKLESYLLAKEQARVFTHESLQAQIDYRFAANHQRRAVISLVSSLGLIALINRWAFPGTKPEIIILIIFLLGVLLGCAFLWSSYIFNKASRY